MDIPEQAIWDRQRADQTFNRHLGYEDYRGWDIMSSKLREYNWDFKSLLFPLTGHRSIQNVIHSWGVPTNHLIGVNFMGETQPLDELGVGGFGCGLIDNKRSEELRQRDKFISFYNYSCLLKG